MVLDAFDLGGPVGEVAFVGDAGGGFALGFGEGFEGVVEFLLEGGAYHGGRLSLLAEIPQAASLESGGSDRRLYGSQFCDGYSAAVSGWGH